jgi:mannose-6-phosphate isomerase-like protein (cupin superfamily)
MLRHNSEFAVARVNAEDGSGGFTTRSVFADKKEMPAHVRLASEVVLQPGEKCASHAHKGESEIYYILSGRAVYEGAEGKNVLWPGDATVCYDGESHAIRVLGDEPLRFLAFITGTK